MSGLFPSFFLGGFECSTHRATDGRRLDVIAATQHDVQATEDYALCRRMGVRAVRESARWPILDRNGTIDVGYVRTLARHARDAGLVQIWDLMHYGYPDDVDLLSVSFVERFAAFARAIAAAVRTETDGTIFFTPVNEISYNAWAAGEVAYMAPYRTGEGAAVKRALVAAAIAGANAIWEVDADARTMTVEPLVRLHAPTGRPDLQANADHFNHHVVTEAFDLLAGRREPELGGSRAHLGIVGLNYYSGNQWTVPSPEAAQRSLHWDDPDAIPLSDLLCEIGARYGGPLVVAETGASGDARAPWMTYLALEARRALELGVDLQGICLYPIITSPDWEDPTAFFNGGLFDVSPQPDGTLARRLARPFARALQNAQAGLDPGNVATDDGLESLADPEPDSSLQVVRPAAAARFNADNFGYLTVAATGALTVELLCVGIGGEVPEHAHERSDHVLTVISGRARLRVGHSEVDVGEGESVVAPAGRSHIVINAGNTPLIVQQVTAPKAWDARFSGVHPTL